MSDGIDSYEAQSIARDYWHNEGQYAAKRLARARPSPYPEGWKP